jgi:DNA-binding NarL/FixJ family response regulator
MGGGDRTGFYREIINSMLANSTELDSFRRRIDSLRVNNSRLRDDLERETQRLLNFQQRTTERQPAQSALKKQLEELTARELEVLRCIAEGNSTKEIGDRLGITFKTAACHRHRLMQKLDVHGTGALVRLAIASGVVNV